MIPQGEAHNSVSHVKLWLFPTLVVILGTIIWNDIKEIKSDVKALMAQSNVDKTRIDNLEKQLDFYKGSANNQPTADINLEHPDSPEKPFSREFIVKELYVDTRQKKTLAVDVKKPNQTTL